MPITDTESLARIRRLLDEDNAKLVSLNAVSHLVPGSSERRETVKMVRYWPKISDGDRVSAEEFLRLYASADNAAEAVYVTDPKADRETRPGRWRPTTVYTSKLKTDPSEQGVFQTLIYWPEDMGDAGDYCAESSVVHHEDVAQEIMADGPASAGHVLVQGEVVTARNSYDPETGTWNTELRTDKARQYGPKSTFSVSATESVEEQTAVNQKVAAKASATEESGKVVRSNLNINRFGDFDTTLVVETGKPTMDDGKTESAESSETTTAKTYQTAKETAAPTDGQIVRVQNKQSKYPGRWETVRTVETGKPLVTTEKTVAHSYEETTEATQTASAEIAPPTTETGFIKTVRNEQSKYPGRWNVLERIRRILHIPSAVKYDSRDDAAAHGRTEESTGVPNTSGVAVVLSADAGTAVRAQVRYDKESDTLDVSKDTTTAKEQVTTEITEARSYRETVTHKTAQASPLPDPTETTGFIKTVRNEASDFAERYNTTERIREIKEIDESVKYDNRDDAAAHGQTEESLGQPNSGGVSVVLSADAGTAVRAQVRYDKESDTLDVSRDVTTAKEQVTTEITEARSYRETVTQKTAQASPLPSPSAETGFIKTVRNEASDYADRVNTTERTREIKAIDEAVEYDHADDASAHGRTVERIGQPNSGIAVVLTAGNGESVTASVRYDKESDTLDVEEKTLTAKPQENKRIVSSAGFTETTTEKTAQGSPAAIPSAVQGHIKTARTVASRFEGKYDVEETDREVKALDATAKGGGPLWDVVGVSNENANTDLSGEAAGGVGTVVETSSNKNEAGLFNNRKSTRTAKPFGPKTDTHGTPLTSETTEYYRNQDAFPNPGTPDVGSTIDVSGSINDAGKIDYQKTTRTGKAVTLIGARTGENEFAVEDTDIHLNAQNVSVPREKGQVVDASVTINEFGTQNVSVRKSTAKSAILGPLVEHDDGYKRTTKKIYRNVDYVPTVNVDDNGHDISFQYNEHGKTDVVETQTTVRPFSVTITEPSTSGKHPGFKKIVWGLSGAIQVQPEVDAFIAQVAAKVDEQYRISCGIDRDENGFYVVTMSANPKESGGSVQNWDQGIDIDTPKLEKRSTYKYVKYTYKMTSNPMIARNFLHSGTNPVEGTEAVYIGRGRYKACLAEGSD